MVGHGCSLSLRYWKWLVEAVSISLQNYYLFYLLVMDVHLKGSGLPAQAAVPGSQLADSIAWGGKEGMQDRQARSKESLTGAAMSIWKRAASKLFDLEAKIVTQVCSHLYHTDCIRLWQTWRMYIQHELTSWQS